MDDHTAFTAINGFVINELQRSKMIIMSQISLHLSLDIRYSTVKRAIKRLRMITLIMRLPAIPRL